MEEAAEAERKWMGSMMMRNGLDFPLRPTGFCTCVYQLFHFRYWLQRKPARLMDREGTDCKHHSQIRATALLDVEERDLLVMADPGAP